MDEDQQPTNLESAREFETLREARDAAYDEATGSGGRVYPCTVFRQGGRWMISTSFPFPFLAKQVQLDSAQKGANPRGNMNRPLMVDHVKTIRNYLLENSEYILPPVTLNLRIPPQLYVQRSTYPIKSGYLIVGDATMFDVTDGQHRIAAIQGSPTARPSIPPIFYEDDKFARESMAVLLVVEKDMDRIHQDFADAAQTKQIPASLLAAYNTREPVNRVLSRLIDQSTFLKGRVDETSKTLPKLSRSVFLSSHLRGFLKELLIGNYGESEEALSRYTAKELATAEQQEAWINRTVELIEILTERMDPWRKIAGIAPGDTRSSQIPEYRRQYLNMTSTGLVIIGRVVFEVLKRLPESERHAKYIELAEKIDWRRDAPIWNGNIVKDGKLLGGRALVKAAAEEVVKTLGIRETVKEATNSSD